MHPPCLVDNGNEGREACVCACVSLSISECVCVCCVVRWCVPGYRKTDLRLFSQGVPHSPFVCPLNNHRVDHTSEQHFFWQHGGHQAFVPLPQTDHITGRLHPKAWRTKERFYTTGRPWDSTGWRTDIFNTFLAPQCSCNGLANSLNHFGLRWGGGGERCRYTYYKHKVHQTGGWRLSTYKAAKEHTTVRGCMPLCGHLCKWLCFIYLFIALTLKSSCRRIAKPISSVPILHIRNFYWAMDGCGIPIHQLSRFTHQPTHSSTVKVHSPA